MVWPSLLHLDGSSTGVDGILERLGIACVLPGATLRNRGDEGTYFEIKAPAAHKLRVVPRAAGFKCQDLQSGMTCADHYKAIYVTKDIKVKKSSEVHRILLEEALADDNKIRGGTRSFQFMTLGSDGNVTGSCTMRMAVVTPIVLDLENTDSFEGQNLAESTVRFDLLGSGSQVQTGWMAPSMGLLAVDRDGDGAITSGAELFGEGTGRSDGHFYKNGYLALAAYDSNKDHTIDARDPIFQKLLVWRDQNIDGLSTPAELLPLRDLGITSISLSYGPSFRHGVPSLGENDVRYESRYFGPSRCGQAGCLTYDVFFATGNSVAGR